MTCSLQQLSRAACASTTMVVLTSGAAAGPVMLIGDAADNHGPQNVYAGLVHEVFTNVTNGQNGILALGVDSGSEAGNWLLGVVALLPEPQLVAFVNDETIAAIGFTGYGMIYVPSPASYTAGGITQAESDLLNARAGAMAEFLDGGGGLVALTQGDLAEPYGFLGEFATVSTIAVGPSGLCGKESLYDNVSPTQVGAVFGITETNLDGCCWGNVYAVFPEALTALATADVPDCPTLNTAAAIVIGFVEIPDVGFDPPDTTLAVGEPNVEAVGDLDGEGSPDMVAVIPDEDPKVAGRIQVFLNQGVDPDGTWLGLVANEPITVGRNPTGVAVGLFNNDAHVDLAVINGNDDNVLIFINTGLGDGTFETMPAEFATGDQPSAIVARDFNEDTFVDLAVTNAIDENLVLLFNDGNGNFAPAESFGLGFGFAPTALFTGDFDDNKCPDLAGPGDGGGAGPAGSTGLVFVMLGQGGGVFAPPAFYTVGRNPSDISAGDIDGDGFLDIVTSDRDDDTASVLINLGDGTFAPRFALAVGAMPSSVDVVDLNIDARPDVVVVADDLQIGPAIQVLENQQETNGADEVPFSNPIPFDVGADPNFVTNADFNLDGLPDLVTVNSDDGKTGGSVSVLLNNPPSPPCEGDFNGDGFVNVNDLLELLANWGPCPAGSSCPWDLSGDGVVNVLDFLALLQIWGICADPGECPWDLNGDGVVDDLDIEVLLDNVGPCDNPNDCPEDLDGDGFVGLLDLWTLLLHLGDCE